MAQPAERQNYVTVSRWSVELHAPEAVATDSVRLMLNRMGRDEFATLMRAVMAEAGVRGLKVELFLSAAAEG